LDVKRNAQEEFSKALASFAEKTGISVDFFKKIKKISGEVVGIKANVELRDPEQIKIRMKEILHELSKKKKVLLLLDEVQVLTKEERNESFIAGLRTALDLYKDTIKVIFTGSSREGLRRMFSQAQAPFFHFGQNLPFPDLGREFTDHLAKLFLEITKRHIDKEQLWVIFQEFEKVPQLVRSLVERVVLYPNLPLEEVKIQLLDDIYNDRAFANSWDDCSAFERILLMHIAAGDGAIFSKETQIKFGEKLGIRKLSTSMTQSAIRSLQRKSLIGKNSDRGNYFIEDPNFKSWLLGL